MDDGEGDVGADGRRPGECAAEDGRHEPGREGDAERRAREQEGERGDEMPERYRERRSTVGVQISGYGGPERA